MCHPKTFLSKPDENRLHIGEFSFHATDDTIRRWPSLDVLCSRAILWPLRSNSRIDRLSCGMAITPLVETANRFTGESVRIVVKGARIFRNSQIFTDLSSEPEMTLSSFEKIVDVTDSEWPWKTLTAGISERKSHSRNVESRDEVTTSRWFWWAQQCVSSESWPVSVCIGDFVSISHSIAVRSQLAVMICVGESAEAIQSAATTTELWPLLANSCSGVRSVSILSRSSLNISSTIGRSSSSSSSDEWPRVREDAATFSQLTAPSQMWAELSPLAVKRRSFEGWNRIELQLPEWPSYLSKHLPVSILQMQATWSALAVAIKGCVRLAVTSHTPSVCEPIKSRTRLDTIDWVLKLDTIRLVWALILCFVPLAVNFDLSFLPSEISQSAVVVEGRSIAAACVAPLSALLSCSRTELIHERGWIFMTGKETVSIGDGNSNRHRCERENRGNVKTYSECTQGKKYRLIFKFFNLHSKFSLSSESNSFSRSCSSFFIRNWGWLSDEMLFFLSISAIILESYFSVRAKVFLDFFVFDLK